MRPNGQWVLDGCLFGTLDEGEKSDQRDPRILWQESREEMLVGT